MSNNNMIYTTSNKTYIGLIPPQDPRQYTHISEAFYNMSTTLSICSSRLNDIIYTKCTFIVPTSANILDISNFLTENYLIDCTIFIEEDILLQLKHNVSKQTISYITQFNTIKTTSFVNYITTTYGLDWNTVPKHLLSDLKLCNENLENIILPTDEYFFINLHNNTVSNCILPIINFNNYKITPSCYFENIEFNSNTIFSHDSLIANYVHCYFPAINLKNILKKNTRLLSFDNCTFSKGTTFPYEVTFFIRNSFIHCYLPEYDYSYYMFNDQIITDCIFDNKSVLPDYLINSEKINVITKMQHIPDKYLNICIHYGDISSPLAFISKYKDYISQEDIFLIYKKYGLY